MPARLALAALFLLLSAAIAEDTDNATCLECHNDRDIMESKGFVDAAVFQASVHGSQDCINCHYELEETDYPHRTGLAPVDCAECHDAQGKQHAGSVHGKAAARGDELAPTCRACHGTHDIRSHTDPRSPTSFFRIPLLCARCHKEGSEVTLTHELAQEGVFEHYSQSLHGDGVYKKGLIYTAVCTSCHTSHDIRRHEDPKSSIHVDNVVGTCTKCHALIEQVHKKRIEERLWEEEPGRIPVCIDCHPPHDLIDESRRELGKRAMTASCLECHGKPDLTTVRDGRTVSLFVDFEAFQRSVHSQNRIQCAQCHSDVLVPGASQAERPCASIRSPVKCSACHEGQVADYTAGIHGRLRAQGDPDAPGCLDCHDRHAVQSRQTPSSPTFPLNVPTLCAQCHREGEKAARRIESPLGDIVGSYEMSIHGKGLRESGLTKTAQCASCHTAHRELPPSDPGSSVHKGHIADTCGSCHHGIEEKFKQSIHWPGNGATDGRELPTCEDCHTSHKITRTDEAGFRFRMMDQCGRCHEEEATTFFDTYHGKVSRLGSGGAAKCYDCHGTHNIRRVSDPASTLSRQNVVATCGQCHIGSHRQFAGYLTHATHHEKDKYPWLYWTFWLMTGLLVGTLGFALLHTAAWAFRLWLERDVWRAHKAAVRAAPGEKLYRRFDRYQRMQHLIMLLAFFTLALTGMALKFSYMGWAKVVSVILGGFDSMGVLHRLGGVTLFGVFFSHIFSVWRRKRRAGATWKETLTGPNSILLLPRDLKEVWVSIKWFFGKGPRPRYGRWTYWEKFDYFAVFWGVFVIGTTGLILWFPEFFTRLVPGWFVNVATIIHSDEALLAVGFIFTIHFFNTHFRPDKWPMDPVIFTGRVPIEELKQDKPAEYEALVESGRLEEFLVDPFPEPVEKGARIFGFIALGIGLTLIALIVYTMVFGYR